MLQRVLEWLLWCVYSKWLWFNRIPFIIALFTHLLHWWQRTGSLWVERKKSLLVPVEKKRKCPPPCPARREPLVVTLSKWKHLQLCHREKLLLSQRPRFLNSLWINQVVAIQSAKNHICLVRISRYGCRIDDKYSRLAHISCHLAGPNIISSLSTSENPWDRFESGKSPGDYKLLLRAQQQSSNQDVEM